MKSLLDSLEMEITVTNVSYCTDSQVILHWIKGLASKIVYLRLDV